MKDIADLLGRIFIAIIFFYEAVDSMLFYQSTKQTMQDFGITWLTDIWLIAALCILLLGATLVLIGYQARFGAFLLILYIIPFTLIVYSFWNDPPTVQRVTAMNFMRNFAVLGGLLLLLANGAGKFSIRRLIYVLKLPK